MEQTSGAEFISFALVLFTTMRVFKQLTAEEQEKVVLLESKVLITRLTSADTELPSGLLSDFYTFTHTAVLSKREKKRLINRMVKAVKDGALKIASCQSFPERGLWH